MRRFAILGILVVSAVGQQPAPTVKFSTTTNLVVVDVTVREKSGKLIEGLKAGDFTIMEDGKPQKLTVFEFQKLSEQLAPPEEPPALEEQNELPPAPKKEISAPAPGKVQYQDKRLLVLFFDLSSMGIPEQIRAQESALTFLDKQMTESDLVAIMTFSSRVKVETDFTKDRTQLKEIVKKLPIGMMAEFADEADTAGEDTGEDTGAAFVADETEFNMFNTDRKLAAIEQVSRKLAALPEKKALVYFSSGVGKTGVENQAQLRAAINAAMKANIAIYPVDSRGLIAMAPGGDASKAMARGKGMFSGAAQNQLRARINDQQETLTTLAADTGGKTFIDNNDLSLGIVQAQKELRSYYILGYYSGNDKQDGHFRKITVKLNGNQSARLEHRPGYYAGKVWGKFNEADKEQQLTEALGMGDPMTELPLALEVDYFRIGRGMYFVPVSLKVPGSVIELARRKGNGITEFDFAGQIQDERRQAVGSVRDSIKIKLTDENVARLTRRSFQYDAGFTLAPGKYRMKFLVRENQTGKMGTFETRFVIPDLASDSYALKMSSVLWSSQKEPVKAAVGAAEKASKKAIEANPMIVNGEKVIPSITRFFRRDQNLYVTFDVYDAQPDPVNPDARSVAVTMSLFNAKGAKAFEAGPLRASQLADTRPNAVPVQFQVPLKELAPGRYICQLNVVDEVGRKFAFPRATLVLQ